ncbi:hypothetical protein LOK49_LG11G01114 [Camellia lanceoleosa]|uniref:Uncharacterized protein n=1 Tax=Camellia lanceoleosa TaxID=1840588 RepID=A0ACC0G1F1_9ERIC|nr:hypothetical protein LOK49_LG11G01114 [Camellia lanceoleosa]
MGNLSTTSLGVACEEEAHEGEGVQQTSDPSGSKVCTESTTEEVVEFVEAENVATEEPRMDGGNIPASSVHVDRPPSTGGIASQTGPHYFVTEPLEHTVNKPHSHSLLVPSPSQIGIEEISPTVSPAMAGP